MSTSSPRRFARFSRFLGLSAGAALVASGAVMGTATAADDLYPEPEHHEPGMTVDRPLADPCQVGEICIWDGPNGQGNRIDYSLCTDQFYDVTDDGLERVGSFINNQTDGTVAEFYYLDENGQWQVAYESTAFEFRDNDQGHPYVTRVDPC